jgi:hypothetical protein
MAVLRTGSSQFLHGVYTKKSGVLRFVREFAYGGFDVCRAEPYQLFAGFAEQQSGERGAAGDGGGAASGSECDFGDGAGREICGKPEDIATNRIRYFNHNCGGRQFADIARILEVVY